MKKFFIALSLIVLISFYQNCTPTKFKSVPSDAATTGQSSKDPLIPYCVAGEVETPDCSIEILGASAAHRTKTCNAQGTAYIFGESCELDSCGAGYNFSGNQCVAINPQPVCEVGPAELISCVDEVNNAIVATKTKTCNEDRLGYTIGLECNITECISTHELINGQCVLGNGGGSNNDGSSEKFELTKDKYSLDSCSQTNVRCVPDEYSSIQAAVNAVTAGGAVLVFSGNYAGFELDKNNTSADNRIEVIAMDGDVIINQGATPGARGIFINDTSYVTIEGFTLNQGYTTVNGQPRDFNGNTPRYTTAYDDSILRARNATAFDPMRGLIIRKNTFLNGGATSVYLSQVADSLFDSNILDTNSGSVHSDGAVRGTIFYLSNSGCENVIIIRNTFTNSATTCLHFNGDHSLTSGPKGIITGLIIEKNVMTNCKGNALNFDGVQDSTIRNNIVANITKHPIRGYSIDAKEGPKNLKIYNNTFYRAEDHSKFTEDEGGHIIFNNLFVENDTNEFYSDNINGSNTQMSNNLVSSQGDTLFTNPSQLIFSILPESDAVNAGLSSYQGVQAPVDDLNGKTRSEVDQGALEN
ncbi:MAG: right-handed parallel beta-helix repeat-containing protein [Bdellovibrionaceae bacterium]|jgi:hypothetical protein|nr:right-handed parallel beta-helix repeat-containing protein [Pseudobdellovibrionaceae bacterium]